MNRPVPATLAVAALPLELEALVLAPLLLPGESLEAYHVLRQAVFVDISRRDRPSNGC